MACHRVPHHGSARRLLASERNRPTKVNPFTTKIRGEQDRPQDHEQSTMPAYERLFLTPSLE